MAEQQMLVKRFTLFSVDIVSLPAHWQGTGVFPAMRQYQGRRTLLRSCCRFHWRAFRRWERRMRRYRALWDKGVLSEADVQAALRWYRVHFMEQWQDNG